MNGRLWRRGRGSRVAVTVVGITVVVAATVGLGVQAVHGAQAVSVQRQSTAARNASLDDAYYGCLDTQAHSLVSPNQSVTIYANNPADFIILLKTAGSWVTFADSPSSAAVQLSLRTVSGGGNACRSSVVVAHYATPQHGRSERVGSERLTGATLDRLTHRCRIIETKGESYRLQDAESRTARVTAPRGATGSNGTATMPVDGAQTTK